MTEPQRLGKYRLLRRIAVGGVAEVYLAVAEGAGGFEKRVVVKRLMPARAREGGVVAMFLDEARLMALFRHPHVAEVYDIGAEGAERFFAMEYVDGCDLRDLLDDQPGLPLPVQAALAIVRAVALGLGHAHAQKDGTGQPLGVVHRDVSPSNVLLGRGGEVKLVDFGVAKWTSQRSHTEHGTLKGKFAYMSPEQCLGETLDGRSDLFALGVLLYELTTGVRPFAAQSDFELMSAIVRGQLQPPSQRLSDYPAALEPVVLRALTARPEDRWPDAGALVEALDQAARDLGIVADAAAVAALLANRARAMTPGLPAAVTGPGARPASDRTATDWSTPPPALPAAPVQPPARPRARLIGIGALGIGILAAGALLWRHQAQEAGPRSEAASAPVPRPAPPRPAATGAPSVTVAVTPPASPSVPIVEPARGPAPDAPANVPAPGPRRSRDERRRAPDRALAADDASPAPKATTAATKSAAPSAAASPAPLAPAAKVIWDIDSPLPP